MVESERYVQRLLDRTVSQLADELRAIMLVGPRGVGKTTTTARAAATIVRLDREREAGPFRADPDELLRSLDPPVLLDEWQLVPDVLGAVKRAVDDHVGHYLLTGSVRAELLEATWAATGRVVRLTQWGLTERELAGKTATRPFFDAVLSGDIAELRAPAVTPTVREYIRLALRGMYPECVALTDSARRRFLGAYVDQLIMRDASLANEDRDPVRLRRYLKAVASNTAGLVEHKSLYDAAGVTRNTAVAYDSVLELLFAVERLPAWHSNRLNRLTRAPKRYITDPALLGPLLGVDERSVLRDGDMLGRVIDTFVVAQLRPEVVVGERAVELSHLRLEQGSREVDLVAEAADGSIVAIEIKATAAPTLDDARHLVWLRDELGERFVAGIVFHTGPHPFRLAERVHALPIATIWGAR